MEPQLQETARDWRPIICRWRYYCNNIAVTTRAGKSICHDCLVGAQ